MIRSDFPFWKGRFPSVFLTVLLVLAMAGCLSSKDNPEQKQVLNLYPDSVSDRTWFHLELLDPGYYQLRFFDTTGALVYEQKLGKLAEGPELTDIDISSFTTGRYTCQLHNEGGLVWEESIRVVK